MSTFNGVVDEFPGIRIDYFRNHPDRDPPKACFLSHVHSDHLQGLETLKMPFVYCSVATKKILLRMEKYPHRINFARGILEARKQTYKSLKSVLRALPVETPVEIELDPKFKIRVTLFDANHCPGAVMFLIEGQDKAILYTGDVRAELWWVNSIVRNPILLPYACGAMKLDCIYLDTTFASREDIYEDFPSKADGLKELLARVDKCPKNSVFYFRSWTLGYEDAWIALSNFLHAQIHVDAYQLRLFKALAEDTSTSDRGPALAGFHYGNQYQSGYLTDDVTVSIHSCEPGTECYSRVKKQKNVVWITPIISRLKDGTEVPEVGAGGGCGDLWQVPQLEVVDEPMLEDMKRLCIGTRNQEEAIRKLEEAFAIAKNKGVFSISLTGLDLDQDEELSLKEFLQLISEKDAFRSELPHPPQDCHRTINFPYSRHSSFSELRHLVSCFRPKDIYPCTINIDNWSEEVSMRTLFGDLCSDNVFRCDRGTRSIVGKRNGHGSSKWKRVTGRADSQTMESRDSLDTSRTYQSAETSLRKENEEERCQIQASQGRIAPQDLEKKTPTPIRTLHSALSNRFTQYDSDDKHNYDQSSSSNLRNKWTPAEHPLATRSSLERSDGADMGLDQDHDFNHENGNDNDNESNISISFALFHSQDQGLIHNGKRPNMTSQGFVQARETPIKRPKHNDYQEHHGSMRDKNRTPAQDQKDRPNRFTSRVTAYRAAKAALTCSDFDEWQDLRLRSLGWKGHTEEEVIL